MTFEELYQKIIKQDPSIVDPDLRSLSEEETKIILKTVINGLAMTGDTEISISRLARIVDHVTYEISRAMEVWRAWEKIKDGNVGITGDIYKLDAKTIKRFKSKNRELTIEGERYKVNQ